MAKPSQSQLLEAVEEQKVRTAQNELQATPAQIALGLHLHRLAFRGYTSSLYAEREQANSPAPVYLELAIQMTRSFADRQTIRNLLEDVAVQEGEAN